VITFSRSAWLALSFGILIILINMIRFQVKPPRDMILLLGFGLLSVLFTTSLFYDPVSTRFEPTARLEEKSLTERSAEYYFIDDVIKLNYISGVGAGAYTIALHDQRPNFPSWSYQPIHNSWLLLFSEIGALGFILFILLITHIYKLIKKHEDKHRHIFAAGIISTIFIISLLDHYLWSIWPGLALLSLCTAVILRQKKDSKIL
jgi:O-antigen ligase